MTKRVQLVRHDNAGANTFLGKDGELTINTGNKSAHVHNGTSEGGTEQARADLDNVAVVTTGNAGKVSAAIYAAFLVTEALALQNEINIGTNDTDIAANLAAIQANDIDIAARASKIVPAVVNNIAVLDAAGDLVDGLKTIAELLARANHTGTQLMSTISDAGALALLDTVDSAQIDTDAVGVDELVANGVSPSTHLNDNITTDGSQAIGAGATWTPPQGLYNMTGSGSAGNKLELYISAAWRATLGGSTNGCVFADGVNMRIKSTAGITETTYWQRFDG